MERTGTSEMARLLLAMREPLYEKAAHLTVITARQPIDELVTDIINRLPDSLSPFPPASPPA